MTSRRIALIGAGELMPALRGISSLLDAQQRSYHYAHLVSAQDTYISLLGEELNDVVTIAAAHGWHSKRAEEGERQRGIIKELKEQLEL